MNKRERKDRLILAALGHVPFDGWSLGALRRGASESGLDEGEVELLFPYGRRQVIEHFADLADRYLVEDLDCTDIGSLRIRERIAAVVRTRLERWTPHREALRQAVGLSLLPGGMKDTLGNLFKTVDIMWKAAGDRSTDYNYYSKRGLLAGVYSSTVLFWLNDRSSNCSETWAFLDRRIEDVMKLGHVKKGIQESANTLPYPFCIFRSVGRARSSAMK